MAKEKDDYFKDSLEKVEKAVDGLCDDVRNIDKTLAAYKASFDHHINQDEKMYEEFKRMNDILSSNTDSLKEHMHRTELLEDAVLKMNASIEPIVLEKVKRDAVKEWNKKALIFLGKFAAAIAALGSVIALLDKYM